MAPDWKQRVLCLLLPVLFLAAALIPERSSGSGTPGAEIPAANQGTELVKTPQVALTFDDGPSAEYTPELLTGLKKRKIKATFFLQGQCLAGHEEIVKQMHEDGHLIGNHTFHHVELGKLSKEKAQEEICKAGNAIYEITGEYPEYIRPPFGSWKKEFDLSFPVIPVFWTIDSRDWETQNTEKILQAVFPKVKDGSIILMHDEYPTSVEAALLIADQLLEEGYRFVTVDELVDS